MKTTPLFHCLVILIALTASCAKPDGYAQYWVVSRELKVFASATKGNDVIATLKFGDEVQGREPNLGSWVPKHWLEIRFEGRRGYVDRTGLADKATIDAMQALVEGVKDLQVQGLGVTSKKTPFQLGPSPTSTVIELLKEPEKVEIFERLVVDQQNKGTSRKGFWYKVRLEDGRVGFVSDRFRLATPAELNPYTAVRRAVAWRVLREREDPKTGSRGNEYVVAYVSEGTPVDVDFTRIEVYSFNPATRQYGTLFAKGGLSGKLPLTVQEGEEGGKIIEVRQALKDKPGKLLVQEYSFPDPVKLLREHEVDQR